MQVESSGKIHGREQGFCLLLVIFVGAVWRICFGYKLEKCAACQQQKGCKRAPATLSVIHILIPSRVFVNHLNPHWLRHHRLTLSHCHTVLWSHRSLPQASLPHPSVHSPSLFISSLSKPSFSHRSSSFIWLPHLLLSHHDCLTMIVLPLTAYLLIASHCHGFLPHCIMPPDMTPHRSFDHLLFYVLET